MRMFDSVVLLCDQAHVDVALAVRAALELFRLHVHFYLCVQKRQVAELLQGNVADAEYVILCGLGSDDGPDVEPDKMAAGFGVVDEVDGRWESVRFTLTPRTIPERVRLPGRKVVVLGCNSGHRAIADAFLSAGCVAYIGADAPVDQDAAALFAIGFFYHLLVSERDSSLHCSEREAFERAAAMDQTLKEGTGVFRHYSSEQIGG